MNKNYVIVALFIFLLLAGIVYYEVTRDKYKEVKSRWSEAVQLYTSETYGEKLRNYFTNTSKQFFEGNFSNILVFIRTILYYDYSNDIDRWRSQYPDNIIPVKESLFTYLFAPARCQEFALDYLALANAFHVQTRLVIPMGFDHMWNEVYINGTWTHVDPSLNVRVMKADGIWHSFTPSNDPFIGVDIPKMYVNRGPIDSNNPVFAFEIDRSVIDVTERYRA